MGDTPHREAVGRMHQHRDQVLSDLDLLASLAAEHGLSLLLHPQLGDLVSPTRFDISSHRDDDEFLRHAMGSRGVLVVVCSVQVPSGMPAADSFPRSVRPLELVGQPFASVHYSSWSDQWIDLGGASSVLPAVRRIRKGIIEPSDPHGVKQAATLSAEEAWEAYEAEVDEVRRANAAYVEQRDQRDRDWKQRQDERDREAFRLEAERRAAGGRELEERHGELIVRVIGAEQGVVEIRRRADGSATYVNWTSETDRYEDGDEPVGVTSFGTVPDALVAAINSALPEPELDFGLAVEQFESALVDSGIGEFAFVRDGEEYVFDGEHILAAAFAHAESLAMAEDELDIVWSFHAGIEGPRWVREIYESIGSTNGVFFYVEREDEDGSIRKLGRISAAQAMEDGMRVAVRSDEVRSRLLREDPDSGDSADEET